MGNIKPKDTEEIQKLSGRARKQSHLEGSERRGAQEMVQGRGEGEVRARRSRRPEPGSERAQRMGLWRDMGGWCSRQRLAKAVCQEKAGKDAGGGGVERPEAGASRWAREDGE